MVCLLNLFPYRELERFNWFTLNHVYSYVTNLLEDVMKKDKSLMKTEFSIELLLLIYVKHCPNFLIY